MILFAEVQMQGSKHVMINSGMINILTTAYKDEGLIILADDQHYSSLLPKIRNTNQIHSTTIFKYDSEEDDKRHFLRKVIRQSKTVYQSFRLARKYKCRFIVFSSAFPFVMPLIDLLSGFLKVKIIVCQHGDIGVLLLDKNRFTTKVFRLAIERFLKYRNVNFNTFLFYGETIKLNLTKLRPKYSMVNVITIDHPYEYLKEPDVNTSKSPIVIANIGMALLSKNSHFLFRLAAMSKELIETKKIVFTAIGSVAPDVLKFSNEYVEFLQKGNEFIPAEHFEKALNRAHYFIFFFGTGGYYDLCPSGTFFDAIRSLRPIISLRNDFIEYYFKKLGNIGYICDNIEDMFILIEHLALEGVENAHYDEQVNNLINAKHLLSIDSISIDFGQQAQKLRL